MNSPLTRCASDVNSRHDDIVTSDDCSASYRKNHQKNLEEEKVCYKMVYYTLYLL